MKGNPDDDRPEDDREPAEDARPYMTSHRALTACAREFGRLSAAVGRGAATLAETSGERLDVRVSPDRCVVQLGSAALTLGWLRHTTDAVDLGQLLVIVWRGTIAQRGAYSAERPTHAAANPPKPLWEEAFVASGRDEASWLWRPATADIGGYSSPELADRCLDRLRDAQQTLSPSTARNQ